jgi:hypothetical protein
MLTSEGGRYRPAAWIVGCSIFLVLTGACGDSKAAFEYTPEPVFTLEGLVLTLDHEVCAPYSVDRVLVVVNNDALDEFRQEAAGLGFEITSPSLPATSREATAFTLLVPTGSVRAALREMTQLSGVTEATASYIRTGSGIPPWRTMCTPAPSG